MDVVVTNHAYEQYVSRVEDIDRLQLTERLNEQIQERHRRVRDLIQLDGIWWAYRDGYFITCYGRTDFDLPKAIGWAKMHNDNIVL